jgi:hypothetical protein
MSAQRTFGGRELRCCFVVFLGIATFRGELCSKTTKSGEKPQNTKTHNLTSRP